MTRFTPRPTSRRQRPGSRRPRALRAGGGWPRCQPRPPHGKPGRALGAEPGSTRRAESRPVSCLWRAFIAPVSRAALFLAIGRARLETGVVGAWEFGEGGLRRASIRLPGLQVVLHCAAAGQALLVCLGRGAW